MTHSETQDAQWIEQSLEAVAAHAGDISPLVYAQFFATCPQAAHLFKVVDPTQPPHGCGQMLFEILSLVQDCATNKPYVEGYMRQIASDHRSFGVDAVHFYGQFFESIVAVLREASGPQWSADWEAAWARQSQRLTAFIH